MLLKNFGFESYNPRINIKSNKNINYISTYSIMNNNISMGVIIIFCQ